MKILSISLALAVALAGCASVPAAPVAGAGQELVNEGRSLGAQIKSDQPNSLVFLERAEQGQAAAAFSQFGTGYNIVVVNKTVDPVQFGPASISVTTTNGADHALLTSDRIAQIKLHQEHMAELGMVLSMVGMVTNAASPVPNAAMQSQFTSSMMMDAAQADQASTERQQMSSAFLNVQLADHSVDPLGQYGGYFVASDVPANKDVDIVVHVGGDTHQFQFRARHS